MTSTKNADMKRRRVSEYTSVPWIPDNVTLATNLPTRGRLMMETAVRAAMPVWLIRAHRPVTQEEVSDMVTAWRRTVEGSRFKSSSRDKAKFIDNVLQACTNIDKTVLRVVDHAGVTRFTSVAAPRPLPPAAPDLFDAAGVEAPTARAPARALAVEGTKGSAAPATPAAPTEGTGGPPRPTGRDARTLHRRRGVLHGVPFGVACAASADQVLARLRQSDDETAVYAAAYSRTTIAHDLEAMARPDIALVKAVSHGRFRFFYR